MWDDIHPVARRERAQIDPRARAPNPVRLSGPGLGPSIANFVRGHSIRRGVKPMFLSISRLGKGQCPPPHPSQD